MNSKDQRTPGERVRPEDRVEALRSLAASYGEDARMFTSYGNRSAATDMANAARRCESEAQKLIAEA